MLASTRFHRASVLLALAFAAWTAPTHGDDAAPIAGASELLAELVSIGEAADPEAKAARIDRLWRRLTGAGRVPFVDGETAVWLYRGEAESVAWPGDHNRWSPQATLGERVAGTDLWRAESNLPTDARIDYKIVRNAAEWLLDPTNPQQVWSGFGPNSELRMPQYRRPPATVRRDEVERGVLREPLLIDSKMLGCRVACRVYTPAGADEARGMPALYVTDGHEYADNRIGGLCVTLDNLIADGELRPTLAVFIDPRDADDRSKNRRMQQYVPGSGFAEFLAQELVPAVEALYPVSRQATDRVVLGTSLGGLAAAHAGAAHPDLFGKLAIQSPAFQIDPTIYDAYDRPAAEGSPEVFLSVGTINDGRGAPKMREVLDRNGYAVTYLETSGGHSWGTWRDQLPTILRTLIGSSSALASE